MKVDSSNYHSNIFVNIFVVLITVGRPKNNASAHKNILQVSLVLIKKLQVSNCGVEIPYLSDHSNSHCV